MDELLPSTAERIIVLRAGALGDTILTLPALHALRRRFPAAHLEVIGSPPYWEVAGSLIDADRSIDRAPFSRLFAPNPDPHLRQFLQDVDLVVAWTTHDPRPALGSGPAVLVRPPYPPPGVHAAAWLLDGLLEVDLLAPNLLSLREEEIGTAKALLNQLGVTAPIFLHPGAGAVWKRWPAERFALVAGMLMEQGHRPVLIEGPADGEAVAAVQAAAGNPLPVFRSLPLRLLAAVLSLGTATIGNDSGVTHLAGAAGVPTLALFGPTDPACWAPLGRSRVVRRCDQMAVRPGQIRVCEDPGCMSRIGVDEALEGFDLLLSG